MELSGENRRLRILMITAQEGEQFTGGSFQLRGRLVTLLIFREIPSDPGDVAMQVIALGVIADLGDPSDLPKLREMAMKREKVESRGRGFGFMPAIDLGRAAQNAADKIIAAGPQAAR